MAEPQHLNSPLTLPCGVTLPNRICKAAMTEGLADSLDRATPELNRLYQSWSEGGAGLLLSGNVMVDHRYLERGGNLVVEDESGLEPLRELAQAGTRNGNHFWMQINHPGRQCSRMVNAEPLSPSDVQLHLAGNFGKPRALTEAEILDIIQRFATTASIAQQAGFTGVQIHSAHGYLGSQFLSPRTNHRTDQWGGSLENRARFLLETIRAVRATVGSAFPISVKLNSADFQKDGFTLEECIQVAEWVGNEGIDLLEISGGTYEDMVFFNTDNEEIRESTRQREAYFLKYAKAISAAAKVPLMITGGFRSVEGMEDALAANETDMVGIGRPFCTDADFPKRMLTGELTQAPAHEHDLVLGKGLLGMNSAIKMVRAINTQGQAGWYYHQIERMGAGLPPNYGLGVFRSFCKYMVSDLRKVMRRKKARAKQPQAATA